MKLINTLGSRLSMKLDSIAFFVIFTLTALAGCSTLLGQTTFPSQIGVESSDRPTGFIDAFKDQGRLFQDNSGNAVPTDASGNPLSDGIAVIFDDRPTPAWAPPIDDPAQYQPDMSGTYTMSFTGQATLSSVAGNPTLTFSNQSYDPGTNTTTVNVYLPGGPTLADGPALMVISFTNTVLNSGGGTNTGIANLQVIRPGFTLAEAANSTQVFDPLFVSAFGPFSYIRFMGWLGTNQNPYVVAQACASAAPACNTVSTPTFGWSERSLPTDIYQGVGPSIVSTYPSRGGAWGVSWEYIILLANATNKDVWINVPINATGSSDPNDPNYVASPDTSSYVYNLAMLFKNGDAFTGNVGLNSGLHIYIEHSNEVWNWGFMQSSWNESAAEAEVAAAPGGVSVLNNDGDTNQYDWAYRRHIKRVYEIGQIFESVFGSGSFGTVIRPVYAWWQLDEGAGSNAANDLAWFKTNYGPPANYFYGMAMGDYFTASNFANDTTIPDVLADMSANSTADVAYVTANLATANQYGLKLMVYEGGPDNSNGGAQNTVNVGPQILANRDPGMDTLVQTHIRNNYFAQGGSTFGYFVLSNAYSRYGDYGATDDYRNLTTAKYNALVNLTGYEPNGLPFSPGDLLAAGGNTAVALSWLTVPGATSYNVLRGTTSGGETLLATVSSPTYSDTAVSNGTTYYYEVTAVNTSGTSGPSNEASATPEALAPSAPALTATAGNAQATLTWTASAGATSYNIYQGSTSGGESTTPIATGVTLTSYTVQSLSNGTTYYFEVAAVNSLGTGAISNEASVTPTGPPAAPTGLTVTIGDGQAVLAWTSVSGAASYNVYQGTASGGEGSTPVATGVTAATYTVTGLTDGTEYFFTVAAVNGAGASGFSNEAAVTPAPPSALLAYEPFGETGTTPFALYGASGGGDSGWGAAWDEQGGSTVVPGYNIASATPLTYTGLLTTPDYAIGGYGYQSAGRDLDVSSSGPFSSYLSSGAIGAPGQTIWLSFLFRVDASNIDTGAVFLNTSNTDWYYSASNNLGIGYFGGSSNDAGGNPWWSLQFNGTTIQSTAPMVVGQPALLVVEDTFGASGQPDQINLFVNPISLGGAAPATPTLQYSPANSTAFQGIAYYGGNNTNMSSLADIRLGATFAAVTPATVVTPAAPTGLTATAGNGQAALSWTASTGATSYNVYEGTASGGEGTTPVATGITGASYTATGLTNGTTYYFTVAAVNSGGTSGVSNEASATPLGPIVIPAAPTGLTATAGSGQVALSWTGSTGAVSYNVYQGTTSGGEGSTPVATGISTTIYTVTGLTAGTTVYFTVAAVDTAGTSGPSNEASATPAIGYGAGIPITVPNYSFELDNQSNYIVPQDWTFTTAGTSTVVDQVCNQACNSSLTNITGTYFWNPSVQNNGSAPFGTGTSTLTTTSSLGAFAANTQYVLTVALAANNPSASSVGFELLGNGVPVATFVAPTTGNNALSSTALQDYSLTFTTVGNSSIVGQSITVALVYTYTGQYGKAAQFDNVRLTQALETGLPPLAPTGLTATAGSAQVALSWMAVSGAASYNVYQGTTSGGESSTPVATGITATTYTVTGLTDGTNYFFTVAAVNGAGVSDVSNEATAIPQFVYGSATPITVPNYSFELGDGSGNNSGYIYPVDWNFTSSGTDGGSGTQYVADNATAGTPLTGVTGSYYWAPGANDNGSLPYGSSTATLTSASSLGTFAADTLYSLTVALGASGNSDLSNFQVGFQLLANGVPVANFVAPTSGANALPPGCNCPGTGLADYSLTFSTAGLSQYVGENITVALVYTFTGQYGRSAYFDNVRLTQAQAELPPTAPTGLTAISGNGQAALSWTASTGATSYNVYEGTASGGEGTTPIATGITGASYTATGLTIGTTYYFTVAAVNTSGVSAASNEASAVSLASPVAPTGLTAAAGNGQVALSWTATAGATSYNVYEGTASGAESTTPVATGVTAATYTVSGLTGGTAYFFTVAAVNTAGTSGYSNEATATPASVGSGSGALLAYEPFGEAGTTPFALNGAGGGGDSGWIAAWDVQGGNASVPGYNIASASPLTYTGLVTTPDYAVGGSSYLSSGRALDVTSTGPFSSYLSSGLIGAPGQTIWLSFLLRQDVSGQSPNVGLTAQGGGNSFWINPANIEVGYFGGSSNDSGGNPWWSLQYNGTTIQTNAPVVTGQAALFVVEDTFGSNGQPDQINLFVNPISLSGAAPATPTLQYSPANSTAFQSIAYYGGDNTNMSSLADIRVGTSYAAVTPALPVVIPPSPASLTATPGNGLANLTWTPVTGATSYNVYQGTASGGESATPVATGVTAGNYTVTGLTNNTTYYFEVAAVNAAGTGAFSSEASVTPSVVAGIPAAPVLAAAAGDQTATLSWNAVPGASTYNVYEATTSGGEGTTPVVTGITGTTYTVSGLTDETTYFFQVSATNSSGSSALSNQASATPAPAVAGTNAPAVFSIYPQVVAAHPVPAGFSMAPAAGGGQIGENAWLSDGGFNALDNRLSLTADTPGTTTTFIDQNNSGGTSYWQSIASGFFVGATARTYRYIGGAWTLLRTDTVTGYTAPVGTDTPTAANSTVTFAASGPATEAGDIIWLDLDDQPVIPNVNTLNTRFTTYDPSWQTETQNGQSRSVTWPVTLSTNVPASDPGGLSAVITDTNTETQGIWQYIQSAFVGPADEEFQPGHTYEFDVWLMQSGIASGSVTVEITGLSGISHTFTGVSGTWQEFTWTFAAPAGLAAGSSQPTVRLDYSAPGTLYVDNFQLYDTAWAPNTVSPQVMTAWQNYQPGTVRIWSNFSNSGGGYSFWGLDSWLTPEIKSHNTTGIGNQYTVSVQLEHLPDALANVKTIGTANPWLIVNMALSEVEWGELIDYLAAPAGTGYASMRPANHPGPYTADFSTIYLEVGNEEWGTQSVPADTAYGQWAHFVITQATAGKSYFNSGQIKFIVNGFVLEPGFGSAAIAAAPEASYTEAALYSNGNTALTGDPYYQSDLVQVPVTNGPQINALVAQQQLDAASGRVYGLAAYEEGPGNSTTPGDMTLAAAIGAIDVNLYASQSGFGPQNFFLYNLGTGPWSSHNNFANGFRPHPVWEALQMRNNYCSGPIVLTTTNSVPTYSDPTITNGQPVPLIAVYTFQDAHVVNQADVVVISRDLNNDTPVTLNFPATPTGTANLYTLTGDPRATNTSAMNIPIGSTTVSVTANYTFTMPPGSMYIFQVPMTGAWSSTGVPTPTPPVSLSASAGNGEVTLTWAASEGATGYTVLRGATTGGPYTQIGTSTSVAYTDTAVTNGTTYYYVVEATNSGGASAYSTEASATPNVEDDSSTATAPPLDGSNTGTWANAPFIPLTHYFSAEAGTNGSPDTAAYKTLWDSNYLYVLVSVQDPYLIAPTAANIWTGSTVEVYFSGTDTKSTTYGPTDFQYAFPYGFPAGGAVVTEADHSPASLTGVLFGQQNITGGYQMAMALPWTTLGTVPVLNQQYGFDVIIDDASVQGTRIGKLAWWATCDCTWDNPSLMGPLVLIPSTLQPQTITFNDSLPSAAPYSTGLSYTISATGGGSGNPVTFQVSGPATLTGSTLNITGVGTVTITANQASNTNYLAAPQVTQSIVISQATPAIVWATPEAINYGTALSATQLDATASVAGSFVYTPVAGTTPPVGNDTLSVTFTPTDATDYTTATATVTLTVNSAVNPAPVINSMSPAYTSADGTAFTLTVNGSGFTANSTVYWGASALATTYGSATQLMAQVTAADIATAGITAITVQTPTPGGGTSSALQFEVDSAGSGTVTFTTVTATVTPGSTATYPVILPSDARNVTVMCLNLPPGAACSYSATTKAVTITTSSTTPAGTYQITVVFTETVPGAATGFILLPILLLPLVFLRRKMAARGVWVTACLGLILLAGAAAACVGCGGSAATHEVTSSGVVSLTVQ